MLRKRTRIDRRLRAARPPTTGSLLETVVVFSDAWGYKSRRYDFDTLHLPPDVRALFADAFREHCATFSDSTRRSMWTVLGKFARFVAADGHVRSTAGLSTAMVHRYIEWIDCQKSQQSKKQWSSSTRRHAVGRLATLIKWTKRNHPERLPVSIDFPYAIHGEAKGNTTPLERLSATQIKAILRECYKEIDASWQRFQTGKAILKSVGTPEPVKPKLCVVLRKLAAINGGFIPSLIDARESGVNWHNIREMGGLRHLASYLHLTPVTAAPFYIALTAQLAGNPNAIRLLSRDCQISDISDEHPVWIDWRKPRAGRQLKLAQRRSYDRRKRYAAPNLIDKLLSMTAAFAGQAEPPLKNRLFLVWSDNKKVITQIGESQLNASVKRFIERTNTGIEACNEGHPARPREPLAKFTAAALRGSSAIEHYKASGGDIVVAQRILNHASIATTEKYVVGQEMWSVIHKTIQELQSLLVEWFQNDPASGQEPVAPEALTIGENATLSSGAHDCRNPLAGVAPGSTKGRTCPHFGGCLLCPNLVILLNATQLAKILQMKREFERARDQMSGHRWRVLYLPFYLLLVEEILPDFPESLYRDAENRLESLPTFPKLY